MLIAAEFYGCRTEKLFEPRETERAVVRAIREAGLTVLKPVRHVYEPQGFTVVVLLKESHIAVHTWPEHHFAAADIFTCGYHPKGLERARKALVELRRAFRPVRVVTKEFARGERLHR
jgi:S-adenosylmethionine decarboxylase